VKNTSDKVTQLTRGSVLDELGFSLEHATALKFKAELHQALLNVAKKYTQRELQVLLRERRPRVSELLNGKIAKSVGKLLTYVGRLGIEAKATLTQTNKVPVERELALAK